MVTCFNIDLFDNLLCPRCQKVRMTEHSNITPVLVRCPGCRTVLTLDYVTGFWSGYQKKEKEILQEAG